MEATDSKIKSVVAETVRDTTLGKQVVEHIHNKVAAHLTALQQLKAEVAQIGIHLQSATPQWDAWRHDQLALH